MKKIKTSAQSGTESASLRTTDHETIKKWVEQRAGTPAVVRDTRDKDGKGGILRIDFPGYSGEDSLQPISWDDFFALFEENNLLLLYQEHTGAGKESRFNKFVSRK